MHQKLNDTIKAQINNWPLFQGMSEPEITSILQQSEQQSFKPNQLICKQGDSSNSMFIILFGRVEIKICRQNGEEQTLNVLQQSNHFGELSLLTNSTRNATAKALVDSTLLQIKKSTFEKLLTEIPLFSINLSSTIGCWLKQELSGKKVRHKLGIIGLVRTTPVTDIFTRQLLSWLTNKGQSVIVISDRQEHFKSDTIKDLFSLSTNKHDLKHTLAQHLSGDKPGQTPLIIIDIKASANHRQLADILAHCERIWWLAEIAQKTRQKKQLDELLKTKPALNSHLQTVWLQCEKSSQYTHHSYKHPDETLLDDMRCLYDEKNMQLRKQDLSRFHHAIIGVHTGLALGGGGARSLAHIGVLAALDEHELYFDRVAGTSGGAIISACYAAGFSLQKMLLMFNKEMAQPRWMRLLPYSTKWHLIALFRFGLIENRFRRYLKNFTFDQLLIPSHMVCSDLISGEEVIRSSGNVVDCILETINHPLIGKPIFRDGMSLVDGGVLNNVPSSVLRQHHCDFVLSVDVGAKIPENFGKNTQAMRASEMRKVNYLGTLNRVLEIRGNGLEKLYKDHSDFLIEPDTSNYSFDNFTYGKVLYDIGYNAAMDAMPGLKQRYQAFLEQ